MKTLILFCMLIVGCGNLESKMYKYPTGSTVKLKNGITGTVTWHHNSGITIQYVDKIGQMHDGYVNYRELDGE